MAFQLSTLSLKLDIQKLLNDAAGKKYLIDEIRNAIFHRHGERISLPSLGDVRAALDQLVKCNIICKEGNRYFYRIEPKSRSSAQETKTETIFPSPSLKPVKKERKSWSERWDEQNA